MRVSISLLFMLLFSGCHRNDKADGYGNFEGTEIIVSAESSGRLLRFDAEEGATLQKGVVTAVIDTTQLHYSKMQLKAEREALEAKQPGLGAKISVLQAERSNLMRDRARYRRLLSEGAVPSRQLEEFENRITVLDRQIGSLETEYPGLSGEIKARSARLAQIDDQIAKSVVKNPVTGVVLARYAEPGELASSGKALYRIADLERIYLRVYLSGAQLSGVKIGQQVEVEVDGAQGAGTVMHGTISWISAKAEFTPKIIQTKEERVSMVYAVKVLVPNRDGLLRIGMPGEVRLQKQPLPAVNKSDGDQELEDMPAGKAGGKGG
ncbi:HlyD family secretion protein [Chlorobium sp. KB01]|uniref:HlyD family secretion protein n=1 Tax=Chlorobium sp. KB01 TaxID=1917528 RepID=UPI001E49416D|nr:HlyD family efflux transporter periplasmic adaptor subunit [Chlorobium sp. KB01]